MNRTLWRLIRNSVMFFPLLLVLTSHVTAQTSTGQGTLRGLEGLGVVVDVTNPETEGYGLNSQQLKSSIEAQLSKAGLKVLPIPKMLAAKGKPELYVTINAQKSGSELYAYSVSVRFKQGIMLTRIVGKDSTIMTEFTGTTWEQSDALGVVESSKIQSIGNSVTAQVNIFIKDYLAVNR